MLLIAKQFIIPNAKIKMRMLIILKYAKLLKNDEIGLDN